MNSQRFASLTKDISIAVAKADGSVIKLADYGWRNTAYPIIKPRVGKFYIGRWFHLSFSAKPTAVKNLQDVMLHESNILRFLTTKVSSPNKFYKPRSTFYLTPEAYQQIVPAESRQSPADFSI